MKHKILLFCTICLLSITFVKGQQTIDVSVGISQATELKANAGVDKLINSGENIQIGGSPVVSGGTSTYQYLWSPNTNINSTTLANPLVSPTINTTYLLTITDAKGCTATNNILIEVNTCLTPTGISIDNIGETEATISWDGTASSYNIRYKKKGASSWANTYTTSQNSYTLSGLQPETGYEFEIQSVCSGTTSEWTADVFSTIQHVNNFVLSATKIEATPNPVLVNGRLRVSTTINNSGDEDFEGSIVCAIVEEQTGGTYKVLEIIGGGRDVLESGKSIKLNYELDEVTTPKGWYFITMQYKADNQSSYTGLRYTNFVIEEFTAGLEVNASDLMFTALYGSYTVRVTSNIDWKAEVTKGSSWINLDKTSGSGNGTFGFSVSENPNESDRAAKIEVTAEGIRRTIIISQAAKAPAATPDRIRITNMGVRQNGTKLDVWFYVTDPQSRRLNFLTAYFCNVKNKYASGTELGYNVLEGADYTSTITGKKFYFTIDMSQGTAASFFDPYNEYEFKVGCLTSDGEKANVGTPGSNNENNQVFLIKAIPHAGGGGIVPTTPTNVKVTSNIGSTILGIEYETTANNDAYDIIVDGQKHSTVQNNSTGRTINTTIEVADEGTHEVEVRAVNTGSETKSAPSIKQVVEVTNIPDEPDESIPLSTVKGVVKDVWDDIVVNAKVVFSDGVEVYTHPNGWYYRKKVPVGSKLTFWIEDNRFDDIEPTQGDIVVNATASKNKVNFTCSEKKYNDNSGSGERPLQDNRELELTSSLKDPNLTINEPASPYIISVRNISSNTWTGYLYLYVQSTYSYGEKIMIAKEYVSNLTSGTIVTFDNIYTEKIINKGTHKLFVKCQRETTDQSINTGLTNLKPTSSSNPVEIFINSDFTVEDLANMGNEVSYKMLEIHDMLDNAKELSWMLGEEGKAAFEKQLELEMEELGDFQTALGIVNKTLGYLNHIEDLRNDPDHISRYSKIAKFVYDAGNGEKYLAEFLGPHAAMVKYAVEMGTNIYKTWNMAFQLGTEFSLATGHIENVSYKIVLDGKGIANEGYYHIKGKNYIQNIRPFIVLKTQEKNGINYNMSECLGGSYNAWELKKAIKKNIILEDDVLLSMRGTDAAEAYMIEMADNPQVYIVLAFPHIDYDGNEEDLCSAYKIIIPLKEPYVKFEDLGKGGNFTIYLRSKFQDFDHPYLYIND